MRFRIAPTPSTFIFFRICIILILFYPTSITGLNITQILKNYEECSTFNSLISKVKLDEEINRIEEPFTVLAVSTASPSLKKDYPPSDLKMILSRHIIIGAVNESNIRAIVTTNQTDDFLTLSQMQKSKEGEIVNYDQNIWFYLTKNRTIMVVYHEDGDDASTKSGFAYIKSFRKSVGHKCYLMIVDSLLYDSEAENAPDIHNEAMAAYRERSNASKHPNASASTPKGSMQPHETSGHSSVIPPPSMKSVAASVQARVYFGVSLGMFLMTVAWRV